ncbi:class I SAM-dependent methyltransferase [Actinoplanes sp. HUAS TT8]|uniref:class I SAM-dependent methyltransferase n=1 Tax=Actinoplanes sp. HUAS TT8 TaxID=3447453 RepID=UPI003F51E84F
MTTDEVTPDGCPVEVYLRLPPNGEPDLIDRAVEPGSRILELGCGTGRLANELAARGHRVTGVDESAAMLRHLRGVTPVQARIEELRLAERFDVVLLAANLISTLDERGGPGSARPARGTSRPAVCWSGSGCRRPGSTRS